MRFKVNVDELNAELAKFNYAINNFRPYTNGFIQNTADKLQGFNSDFTTEMERVLNNMTDTTAPKLLRKAESLHDAARQAIDAFVQVDQTIASKVSETKEG